MFLELILLPYLEFGMNRTNADDLAISAIMETAAETQSFPYYQQNEVGIYSYDFSAGFQSKYLGIELAYLKIDDRAGVGFTDSLMPERGTVARLHGTMDLTRTMVSLLPTYPVTRSLSIYGRLGYGYSEMEQSITLRENIYSSPPTSYPVPSLDITLHESVTTPVYGVGIRWDIRQDSYQFYVRCEAQKSNMLKGMTHYRFSIGHQF